MLGDVWKRSKDHVGFKGRVKRLLAVAPRFNEAVHKRYVPDGAPVFGSSKNWDGDGEENVWNHLALGTNCYTYALDIPKHGWGLPGRILCRKIPFKDKDITLDNVRMRLLFDGLVAVNEVELSLKSSHIIAAFVDAGRDYHFFRRDEGGIWSHKFGRCPAMKTDYRGDEIKDPVRAHRGDYSDFAGYFKVPEAGLAYYPRLACD